MFCIRDAVSPRFLGDSGPRKQEVRIPGALPPMGDFRLNGSDPIFRSVLTIEVVERLS